MSDGSLRSHPVGNPPRVSHANSAQKAKSETKAEDGQLGSDSTKASEQTNELQYVPPIAFPGVLVGMRNAIAATGDLEDFLDFLQENTKGEPIEVVETGLAGDPRFQEVVEKKAQEFNDRGSNLLASTLALLKSSTNFKTKSFLTAIALVINDSVLVNDYLVPSLDKRPYFENEESNNKFVRWMLSELTRENLVRIFRLVNFDGVNNNDGFADSIVNMDEKQHGNALNALVDVATKDEAKHFKFKDADVYVFNPHRERIQRLVILIMSKLKKANKLIPKEPLERLYRSSEITEVSDAACGLLKEHNEIDKDKFLLDLIKDESQKDQYYERLRRFWAIADYVACVTRSQAIKGLQEVVLECETPIVVNYATYKLASSCGEEGKIAITDAIHKQIRLNKQSMPLAFIVSAFDLDKECSSIVWRLLHEKYNSDRGLSRGFRNIADLEVAGAERSKEGGISFYHEAKIPPATPVDIFQKIGIIHLFKNILELQRTSAITQTITCNGIQIEGIPIELNVLDLLAYSFARHPREISSLMQAALIQAEKSNKDVYEYLLKLAGASEDKLKTEDLAELFPRSGWEY